MIKIKTNLNHVAMHAHNIKFVKIFMYHANTFKAQWGMTEHII